MQMPPGFGNALKPCCDIDAITKNIVALDQDVTEIDPDPEQHTSVGRDAIVPFGHHRLHCYRAFDRVDYRWKFEQYTVARGLDDPATMLCHERIGKDAVFTQDTGGADLVDAHQTRIASDVGGQYRRQSAVDPDLVALAPWRTQPLRAMVVL